MFSLKMRKLIIFYVLFIVAIVILTIYKPILSNRNITFEIWALVGISVILNVGVILYHYTIPPHPKFLLLPKRKWNIRVHVWSGTIELIFGIIACFFYSPKAAYIQAIAALFFHVPSAIMQTPIVFGSKAIMIPSYFLCIFIHAFCAYNLLLNPDSHQWAINTFLIFNVYAWCRFYFYFFDRYQILKSHKYTVSILFAGLTIIPALFGPLSMILLVAFIALNFILMKAFVLKNELDYISFIEERERDSFLSLIAISPEELANKINSLKDESERDKAEFIFNILDKDQDRKIEWHDFKQLLIQWGVTKKECEEYQHYHKNTNLDFELFFQKMKPVWKFIYFDVLRSLKNSGSDDMIKRSIESLKSTRSVEFLKEDIKHNLLKKVPFLTNANISLIDDLASSLIVKELKQSQTVFEENEPGDRFYMIGKGSVSILKNNETIAQLTNGSCFGEAALINNNPRNATVICTEDCVFYSLSKSSFEYVITQHPTIKEELISIIQKRIK